MSMTRFISIIVAITIVIDTLAIIIGGSGSFGLIFAIDLILFAFTATVVMGLLPGHIARRRGHPWVQAVTVASWVTLVFLCVLWPLVLIWAFIDIPAKQG